MVLANTFAFFSTLASQALMWTGLMEPAAREGTLTGSLCLPGSDSFQYGLPGRHVRLSSRQSGLLLYAHRVRPAERCLRHIWALLGGEAVELKDGCRREKVDGGL